MQRFTITLFLLLFLLPKSNAQNEDIIQEEEKYQISDVNDKEEVTNLILSNAKKSYKQIKASSEIDVQAKLDSLYQIIEPYSEEYISALSVQSLKNTQSAIDVLVRNVKTFQIDHTENVSELQRIDEQLINELNYWENLYNFLLGGENTSESLLERILLIKEQLDNSKTELSEIMKRELDLSSKVSQFNGEINSIIEHIALQDERLRNSYLVRDSEPIWRIHKLTKDSLNVVSGANQVIKENKEALSLFVQYNGQALIIHAIILILLYLLFLFSQNLTSSILSDKATNHLSIFSSKPFLTAYVFSFLFVSLKQVSYPVVLIEVLLITLFFPFYELLKSYIKPESRKFLIIFIVLFIIQLFLNHISYVYISGRLSLLTLEIAISSYLIYIAYHFRNNKKEAYEKLLRNGIILAAILFIASVFANILGIVKLSLLLSVSTTNSIGIGLLVFLFFQISKAFYIVLAEIKPFSKLNIIKTNKSRVLQRLVQITRLFLILIYLKSILKQFKLYKGFSEGWQAFINKSWELGEVAISIGDFLNFFIILFAAIFIAKFLRYFLKGEILPIFIKTRGVPNAISTTVYYIFLVIGFFIAAFSTGIEWSKVNLAIGALSVGIGFGLQNVVYNFIAGLILTYERPVQVGDIVQLDTLMGNIKEIGIRSSRVLTYDGAEVVVPNGNLISNEVINWTLSNNHKRQELKFKASTNANPNDIVEILKSLPLKNVKVISDPKPLALFEGYGDDGTLDFRLLFWTHVDVGLSTKSEVGLAIYEELQKQGYELPVQKSSIRIEGTNPNAK